MVTTGKPSPQFSVLYLFILTFSVISTDTDFNYDFLNDEVEYFDEPRSQPREKTTIIPRTTTTVPSLDQPDNDVPKSAVTAMPDVASSHKLEQPHNETDAKTSSRRGRPLTHFGTNSAKSEDESDLGFGLFEARRSQFVEVKIGEFSATEQFVSMYGRLTNYTNALYGNDPLQVSEFLGVPFAEPPVSSLRFQRPILMTPPDDLLALRHPNPCPQMDELTGKVTGNEDCLQLSIYVPQHFENNNNGFSRNPSKMPVLVWFHGEKTRKLRNGEFSMLTSGSAQDLDPYVYLQNKIVVVTPQYRLGSLGFLSVANEDLNGNMGLLDQVTALEWVQRFISYFGGDPSQVTVMGQGSSAISVGLLSSSNTARSLFHRVILMSGSPTSPLALDTNQKLTYLEIARQNNCPSFPTLQLIRCMQKKGVESLVKADEKLVKGKHLGKFKVPLPVIQKEHDGRFLPPLIHEKPLGRISKGQFQDVPLIIGVTSLEMSGFLPSLSGRPVSSFSSTIFSATNVLRQFIREMLSRTEFDLDEESLSHLVTFEYFAGLNISERQEQAKDLCEEMFSDYLFHMPAITLANAWSRYAPVYFYVFDYVQNPVPHDNRYSIESESNLGGQNDGEEDHEQPPSTISFANPIQASHGSDLLYLMQGYKGTAQDRYIASVMIDAWTSFIYKGSPLQSGLEWPTYEENDRKYLYIGDNIQVRSRFRQRQVQFWSELIKELGEKSKCSSSSVAGNRNGRRTTQGI